MIKPNIDRRRTVRTHVFAGGLLFFNGRQGVRGFRAIDVSDRGLKLRTHRHAILPLRFDLTFDNFATAHRCHLIWRRGDQLGVAFEEANSDPWPEGSRISRT
jgi:hypothetical protein